MSLSYLGSFVSFDTHLPDIYYDLMKSETIYMLWGEFRSIRRNNAKI